MVNRGVNIFRLNFSHDNHEIQYQKLLNIRKAMGEVPNGQFAVMLDTKGPEIRTTNPKDNQQIVLKKDQFIFVVGDKN